jgi:DNA-binding Lrp family transcriptional regulator
MVRSSMVQIDQDEKKVIVELKKNSNEKIETIAKHCGFSRQKTWRIIKRLENGGLIWGYTAICNDDKIGLKHFVLMFKKTPKQLEENTINTIISRKMEDVAAKMGITIENSFYVHGEYDWVAMVTAEGISPVKKFSDAFFTMHPGVVQKISILQTMMFIRKQYALNPERKTLKEFF